MAKIKKLFSLLRAGPTLSILMLLLFVIIGVFGPFFMPHDPVESKLADAVLPPMWQEGGKPEYILGTDHLGRDALSRLIGGARISLIVATLATGFSSLVGVCAALLAGYFGGKTDFVISRLIEFIISMPYMMIALVIVAVLGPSLMNIILVMVIHYWATIARVLRGEVLRIKEADYIKLAKIGGASSARILVKHAFPNIVNTLIILATLQVGMAIRFEAYLSFLGVGVPPPTATWGAMLAQGRDYISMAWWLCVWPGVMIVLVVLSSNFLGDWLRVRLDPKFRQL